MATNRTAAYELLCQLGTHPVEYIFANGGTDFAPLIEAWTEAKATGDAVPDFLAIPHETAAVAMAHGFYLATGRPQAVMVHVNVGLANAVMGVINAAADQIPLLMLSGRTPTTEHGRLGSRNVPIHWGQDMRDQTAMVRESVKWEYELRYPDHVGELTERALAIAMSEPRGPVYLSLPREVLAETASARGHNARRAAYQPAAVAPAAESLAAAAEILLAAERPLIVSQRGAESAVSALDIGGFLDRWAIAMTEFWPTRNLLHTGHPLHAGFDRLDLVAEADAILVLDAVVPWLPGGAGPSEDCRIIQAGADPLAAARPVRLFASEVSLAGAPARVIPALDAAMAAAAPRGSKTRLAARRKAMAARFGTEHAARRGTVADGKGSPMTKSWASRCIAQAIDADTLIFNELGFDPNQFDDMPGGRYFNHPVSGGLGWGVPAALGAKLAAPDRLVLACIGDGSHIFANPVACHQIAQAMSLPVLIVVFNNAGWEAVRRATLSLYPQGRASKANRMPVTRIDPSPDFVRICEASGGYGERVESGADLPAALERALKVVREEKRQALLDLSIVFGG